MKHSIIHTALLDISFQSGSHTLAVLGENLPKYLIIPRKAWTSLLLGGISINALSFCGFCFTPYHDIISPKNGTDVHLKWHLSLFNFKLTYLHLCTTLHTVLSWSLPSASYPTTNNIISNTEYIGQIFKYFINLPLDISPAGAVPNRGHLYLHLPNWHVNIIKYNDFF